MKALEKEPLSPMIDTLRPKIIIAAIAIMTFTLTFPAQAFDKAEIANLGVSKPVLQGSFVQGGIIRGTTHADMLVMLDEQTIMVNQAGQFVFGFGRDAKLIHTLKWKLPSDNAFTTEKIKITAREYDIQRIEGMAQKYVSPPQEVLSRIKTENQQIAKARATRSELTGFTEAFLLPAKGRISGVYGSQRVFNGEPRRPHYGLDIAGPVGTPVVAPASGVVTLVHDDMYYSGGTLIIDHGLGLSSTFIHLSALHVVLGQTLQQGDLIADIGATGRVTGPHLDWRINWFKERLDPMLLVSPAN